MSQGKGPFKVDLNLSPCTRLAPALALATAAGGSLLTKKLRIEALVDSAGTSTKLVAPKARRRQGNEA